MLTILGARGTIPVSGYSYIKYGGSTPSLFLPLNETAIIFDAGTGLYKLNKVKNLKNIYIFLTHLHWDHIMGLPLFSYFYNPSANIKIFIDKKDDIDSTEFIKHLFKEPFFPVSHEKLNCNLQIENIFHGEEIKISNLSITPFEGNHPNGASMFLCKNQSFSFLYATDFEHGSSKDDLIVEVAKHVNYFIFDTTYTPEDFIGERDGIPKNGWGHSTYEYGAKFAKKAKVKNLILFHHNPEYTDCFLDKMVIRSKKLFSNTIAATEGLILD
ncbi:MBL fold metallo-hydrolase [Deferribacter thermophilus]|uniref:MBL fold metallo-hydrolase n=1 Tax=Deferribacter thermophilus TaxID=53573 RepID=UPI003C21A24E